MIIVSFSPNDDVLSLTDLSVLFWFPSGPSRNICICNCFLQILVLSCLGLYILMELHDVGVSLWFKR